MIIVASLDSSSQTVSASGGDWQEEIYQKVLFNTLPIYKIFLGG